MGAITVRKTEKGFSVKLPFELKDSFRNTFKTAKWDKFNKTWNIGPRSGKRLDEWVQLAEETAKKLADSDALNDEVSLTEDDLDRVKSELSSIEMQIANSERQLNEISEIKAQIAQTIELIEQKKPDLDKTKAKLDAEIEKVETEKEKVKNFLRSVINLDAVLRAKAEMSKYRHNGNDRRKRELYRKAQGLIENENNRLVMETKMASKGLDMLAEMNVNRPDRDDPDLVSIDDILNIFEVSEDCYENIKEESQNKEKQG